MQLLSLQVEKLMIRLKEDIYSRSQDMIYLKRNEIRKSKDNFTKILTVSNALSTTKCLILKVPVAIDR